MQALRAVKRDPRPIADTPRAQSDIPLFWCSGVPGEYNAWPGPPSHFTTSLLPISQVIAVPLDELEDQSVWVREMGPKTCATLGSVSGIPLSAEDITS